MPRYLPPRITSRRLFGEVSDPAFTVRLGEAEPNWHRFGHGYKTAADLLVRRLSDRRVIPEYVCLPILFLYRHYVELSLKALLIDLGQLEDEVEQVSGQHYLLPLWHELRSGLERLQVTDDGDWLDRAEALITELDQLDPRSFTFRYPVDKAGLLVLGPSDQVDLRHFRDVMGELDVVLAGAGAMLDEFLHLKHEQDSVEDYYDYYS